MRRLLLFCLLAVVACLSGQVWAQVSLEGQVLDEVDGQPVSYASLLIEERQSGSVTSESGAFHLDLPRGIYHLEVRALGYETQRLMVELGDNHKPLSIRLKPVVHQLRDLEVRAGKMNEDPAYRVMRRVMYRVPIYRRAFESYQTQMYTRSSVLFKKVPRILNIELGETKVRLRDLVGKTFFEEEISQINYSKTQGAQLVVRSRQSSVPKVLQDELSMQGQSSHALLASNIYEPYIKGLAHCLSPITPGAFEQYKYTLLSRTTEGEAIVYRIAFRQRTKAAQAVSGELEILEGSWAVRTLTIISDGLGMMSSRLVYQLSPTGGSVYLPTTLRANFEARVFGLNSTLSFVTSMSYHDVVPSRETKRLEEDNEPAQRLTNKEVVRHERQINLMDQGRSAELASKHRYDLKARNELGRPKITDSIDEQIDSAYWEQIRPFRLKPDEQQSVARTDSINTELMKRQTLGRILASKGERGEQKQANHIKLTSLRTLSSLFLSGTIHRDSRWEVAVSPEQGVLRHLVYNYNVADRWQIGTGLTLSRLSECKTQWSLSGSVAWAARRRAWLWNTELRLLPSYRHNLDIRLGAGRQTRSIGPSPSSLEQLEHAMVAALSGMSNVPLYDRQQLYLTLSAVPIPELSCTFGAGLVRSSGVDLSPTTGLGTGWLANVGYINQARWEDYRHLRAMMWEDRKREYLSLSGKLVWSTKPYHRRKDSGWLEYSPERRLAPVYTLAVRANVPIGIGGSSFVLAYATMEQTLQLGRYRKRYMDYYLQVGGQKRAMIIAAEQAFYFKTYNGIIAPRDQEGITFYTMPPYTDFRAVAFGTARLGYTAPRLLINYLPFRLNRLTTERLTLSVNGEMFGGAPYGEASYYWGVSRLMQLGLHFGGRLSYDVCPSWAISIHTNL